MHLKKLFLTIIIALTIHIVVSQSFIVAVPNLIGGYNLTKTNLIPNASFFASQNSTIFQKNHTLSRRKLPNDPFIANQKWISQLQVENVWEKYTKQTTITGDTIIVAVIDDGIDSTHPDLKENIYINYKEIPWNSIDDDSNGYVDDYRGWNTADSDGVATSLYNGEHGTPIAGIIAAKGNNNTGITGISWNCKLLNVCVYGKKNNGDDLSLINGFIYVLNNKKLYKKTNGKKGINTHIISLSIGLEATKPEDAPLWCFYLSELAKEGILVCSAVTNSNALIDIVGDIPAMCLTDNLINVNSAYDNYSFSGISKKYVDISADGSEVYSTKEGSDYSINNTGTSFCAPQIAGVAALQLQGACKAFLKLLADSPIIAVKLWKSWILKGDKKVFLEQLTSSGSTLNAQKSINAMDQWCAVNDIGTNIVFQKLINVYPNPINTGDAMHFLNIKDVQKVQFINSLGLIAFSSNQIPKYCPSLSSGIYTTILVSKNVIYQTRICIH